MGDGRGEGVGGGKGGERRIDWKRKGGESNCRQRERARARGSIHRFSLSL
jgi:hypothetical protein